MDVPISLDVILALGMSVGETANHAIVTAIAVLIITCPCALALAIPAVQVVASGALFRAGVILNAGDAIERIAEADTVVFDKSGTLTMPEPRVVNAADIGPDLLQVAARIPSRSCAAQLRAITGEAVLGAPAGTKYIARSNICETRIPHSKGGFFSAIRTCVLTHDQSLFCCGRRSPIAAIG
jgi:magnesium-transporting ATPase (P-type)